MTPTITAKIDEFFLEYPLRTYAKHHIILRADEPVTTVHYLTEGRISQYDITPGGNEVVVNVFKPGAFFPMASAINATPNRYFFEAATPVKVRVAPTQAVVRFIQSNPDVLFDLLSRVYRGMDGVLRRMTHLMGGDARTRLIFELLNACARFGEPQADGSVRLLLKEGEIGKHAGLARETVNRCLQDLKKQGIVSVANHTLTITDVRQLEAMLGDSV